MKSKWGNFLIVPLLHSVSDIIIIIILGDVVLLCIAYN